MKNIIKVIILLVGISFASCKDLVTYYDFDTNPDGLREKTMLSYFESSYDVSRTEYVKAIKIAGLQDVVEQNNITCIVPNNDAFKQLYRSFGVNSVDEMPRGLLRNLLEYLIFPGTYRCLGLVDGENHQETAMSGNPVWIMRKGNADNKYAMWFNDAPDNLSTLPYLIAQQDFLFKNDVVAQVVATFPIYSPRVPATDQGKLRPDDQRTPMKDVLEITDELSLYAGKTVANGSAGNGIALGRTTNTSQGRFGAFKFKLKPISFADDIVASYAIVNVQTTQAGVTVGNDVNVGLNEMPNADWTMLSSYANILGTYGWNSYKAATKEVATAKFVAQSEYAINQVALKFDITTCMATKYNQSQTKDDPFSFAAYSYYADVATSSVYLYSALYAPDMSKGMRIELMGPIESNILMVRNNVVHKDGDGVAKLLPENSFAFSGPTVSDGYNYAPQNIIYRIKTMPQNGMILKNGLPVALNATFTQAEMEAGIIMYVALRGGADSFDLKVSDYINGMYYTDGGDNYITINVE